VDYPGFYVKAFCSGLKEILALYKEHILAIEHEYFVNESLNIAHISHKLQLFFQILPALDRVIQEIDENGLKGG
jgi:hypothetical protein